MNKFKLFIILNILKFQTDVPDTYHYEKSQYIHLHVKNGGKYTKMLQLIICHLGDGILSHFNFLLYKLPIISKFPTPNLYYYYLISNF